MGKWVYMIIIVMIGGMLYYKLVLNRNPATPTNPKGTASAFMKCAMDGDLTGAKALCKPEIQNQVETVVQTILRVNPDPIGIKYNNMVTDYPFEGILVFFQGNMLAMEMLEDNGNWIIAKIGFN